MIDTVGRPHIGKTISLLAKKNGITQDKIARDAGISRISVNRFFRGHTQLKAKDFTVICKAVGVDIEGQLVEALNKNIMGAT